MKHKKEVTLRSQLDELKDMKSQLVSLVKNKNQAKRRFQNLDTDMKGKREEISLLMEKSNITRLGKSTIEDQDLEQSDEEDLA